MLDDHAKSFDTCRACPSLCQSACPVHLATGNRSFAPWGIMQAFDRARRAGELDRDAADASYRCLTCRACTTACAHGVKVADAVLDARAQAFKEGLSPEPIQGFVEKFHRQNNPFSKDLLARLMKLLPKDILSRRTGVAYFAGCTAIAKCPEIVRDSFALFKKLGIDFVGVYSDPIQCCGYPLFASGAHYEFVDLAEINYHSLNKHRMILTGSPTCAYTLRETYRRFDFDLSSKVVTIDEFLRPYMKNINFKVKRGVKTRLMYHDPCHLSRHLGQEELPRELIGSVSGYPPIEFTDHGEASSCCGRGGCYSVVDKENADAVTKKRLAEVYERKVKTVLTHCPSCVFKMRQVSRGLIIKDVVSYLNDSIQGSADAKD